MAERALGQTRRGETGAPGLSPDETSRRKVAKIFNTERESQREEPPEERERERRPNNRECVWGRHNARDVPQVCSLVFRARTATEGIVLYVHRTVHAFSLTYMYITISVKYICACNMCMHKCGM